ncbi:Spx/MgsR family RNA polymerase-binding regulatory protein [Candidatus Thioglobus sp.]|uniref:Spx/MgsR family RNA polymerase-binding regulatory protein n=1 Tax=Candidatus Thioglobus sp. TaxID=2026721 RepID=UPI00261B5F7D|nr:Spx/MgsR family RNA polymerase-binding regulatory protein [Candidatus Thioglobus sp.]MDG2395970.1 Spx/MgsR family RNA polymerase-binding regulatory protein [Candidatus Thioglobus sp.]
MKLYGIKNCDTVKKARKFLELHKIKFEFIDFREQPIDKATLQGFLDELGWDKVINKRSATYRNLTDSQKSNITFELTLKNPTLIKRPVLVTDSDIRVGFSEKSYLDLI